MQCYRCQYWHHSNKNCRLDVNACWCKCNSNNYDTPNRSKEKGTVTEVIRCNYRDTYAASYRGCIKFPKLNKPTFKSTPYNPNQSFTDTNPPPHPTPQNSSQGSAPKHDSENIFNFSAFNNILNEITQQLNFKKLFWIYKLL